MVYIIAGVVGVLVLVGGVLAGYVAWSRRQRNRAELAAAYERARAQEEKAQFEQDRRVQEARALIQREMEKRRRNAHQRQPLADVAHRLWGNRGKEVPTDPDPSE